jgi:hypothetical protein
VFKSRKVSGSLNDCLISVDGTDVCISQQGPAIPGNPSSLFKFKDKCGLQYKIGVDILAGNIVQINGPYADVGPLINLGTQHNGRSARTRMKRV